MRRPNYQNLITTNAKMAISKGGCCSLTDHIRDMISQFARIKDNEIIAKAMHFFKRCHDIAYNRFCFKTKEKAVKRKYTYTRKPEAASVTQPAKIQGCGIRRLLGGATHSYEHARHSLGT